jgi:hypothetical protein
MLIVQVPENRLAERHYILSVLLGEFLGLEFQVESLPIKQVIFISNEESSPRLVLNDDFLGQTDTTWLAPSSLPLQPLELWHVAGMAFAQKMVQDDLPVIYGLSPRHPEFWQTTDDSISLGLDILGSAFFMLTRYEEVVKSDRDKFDRFPAAAALAYQEEFLDRPIVNEYLEILWACLKTLWPGLRRRPRKFSMYLSHDVDEPFRFAFTGLKRLAQRCAGDLLYRKSLRDMAASIESWTQVKLLGRADRDPANTFDLIMDLSEAQNQRSAFYFITDHTAGTIDGVYSMDHPLIRKLLRRIHDRGHEIGLHTSYNTYLDPGQTKREFDRLKQVCAAEGIEQSIWGGRQHFLRWQTPTTFQNWDAAGLDYDSTMTYADCIGFRCGTCYEFPVFDVLSGQALRLRERPLCVMEVTVLRSAYMGLQIANGEAIQAINVMQQRCEKYSGDFTLLWHNTHFVDTEELALYQEVVCGR